MNRQTKNIITRKDCAEKMIHGYKTTLFMAAGFTLIMLIFALISFAIGEWITVLFGVLFLLFVLAMWLKPIIKINRIKKGKFTVVKDRLCRISYETVRYRRSYIEVPVFYFCSGLRVEIHENELQYTEEEDEFFIVILNIQKPRAELMYNAKRYEFKE